MKKLLLSLCAIFALSSSVFAQTLPGGYHPLLSNPGAGGQWFFKQTKVANPYNQNACAGAYANERYYLSGDRDGDSLADIYNPFYLKDNFAIESNNPGNTYRVALIAPTFADFIGTEVYYYTPAGGSNALSIWTGSQNYSFANNNVWFRLSKIAPLNQWVRAVTSEPVLLEIPSSRSPNDAYTQIAYQIRYATYRGNTGSLNSGYQVFPVANSGDFGPAFDSWFLSNNFSHNGGIGPSWTGDYIHTSVSIPRAGITRGPEQAHALECKNYYTSRCGDGYQDVSGQQPINANGTQPYTLPLGGGINEQCDPGSTVGNTIQYIPSSNISGTTCSQTCTIIPPQVTQYANPIIMKFQRNVTRNLPQNGQYTTGMLNYSAGNQVEYKIVISNPSNTLSTHTGVSLREQLPVGFVYASNNPVSIVMGGVVTPSIINYYTNTNQSDSFQLSPGASVTFFIRGTLLTNSPVMRTNTGNLYVGNTEIDDSNVTMNYNTPLTPSFSIIKSQRIRPGATNYIMSGSLPNGPAFVITPLTGNIGDMIDYRIRVTNTGAGTAYLSTIVDNAINAGIPGLNCPVIAVSNMYHITSLPVITSSVYKVPNQALWSFNPAIVLQTNHEVNIYFSCAIIATRQTYNNHGSATWSTGGAMTTTLSNTVIVTTPTPPLPSITLNKEIKTGGMANYGQYEDGHNGALVVNSGDVVSYRITITKTGGPIQPIRLSDIWPSCFTPNDASVGNVNISPSLLVTGYLLPQFNASGSVTVVIIIDGIVTPTGLCGIEKNTAFLSLPVGYPYTILDPWGNQSGISTIAPIRDTADFQLAGYVPHSNLWLEKTVSPPYTSSHNHNLTLQAGSTFRFTLRFGNTGNIAANNVLITDTLPAGLVCTSYIVNAHPPLPFSGQTFTYTSTLLPGSIEEISFSCIISPSATGSFFLNTGYLTYGNLSLSDTASVTLSGNPGFTITKTVNTGVLISGQTLTYAIHFVNTGSQLTSYYIFDPLSPALTYVPNSATLNGLPRAPVQSGNILFWGCNAGSSGTNLNSTSVCPLASGGSGTIVFQALVH